MSPPIFHRAEAAPLVTGIEAPKYNAKSQRLHAHEMTNGSNKLQKA